MLLLYTALLDLCCNLVNGSSGWRVARHEDTPWEIGKLSVTSIERFELTPGLYFNFRTQAGLHVLVEYKVSHTGSTSCSVIASV